MASLLPNVAVIGGTGTTGGWVIERALERGHEVRALTPESSFLASFGSKVTVVTGNSTKKSDLQELLYLGNKLLVETLVCITADMGTTEQLMVARALSELVASKDAKPRVVWMTSAVDEQAVESNPEDSIYPTKTEKPCFNLAPKVDFGCLFPFLNQPVVEDETIDTFILDTLPSKAVVIRPSTSLRPVPYAPFTDEWRAHGGTNPNYQFLTGDDVDQHPAISRRALATAILDLIIDESRDGTAVTAVQRQGRAYSVVTESVEL